MANRTRHRILLQDILLGDREPLQLLNEMRNLARGDIKDEVMAPTPSTQHVANFVSNDSLTNLPNVTDKISEVFP